MATASAPSRSSNRVISALTSTLFTAALIVLPSRLTVTLITPPDAAGAMPCLIAFSTSVAIVSAGNGWLPRRL